jgi:hypothetical protein
MPAEIARNLGDLQATAIGADEILESLAAAEHHFGHAEGFGAGAAAQPALAMIGGADQDDDTRLMFLCAAADEGRLVPEARYGSIPLVRQNFKIRFRP